LSYKKNEKMKKAGLIILFASAILLRVNSQNIDDALRYSQIFYGGTARFMSMGGAFTALGGDLSTLSQNPAGIGVFRSFDFSITPQIYTSKTNSIFNGTSADDYMQRFNLSQAGFVTNLSNGRHPGGLISLNLAYSFNRTNNFNDYATVTGISTNSSMADYWAGLANGTNYKDLDGAPANAFDAWLIDTIGGTGGKQYATIFSQYGSYDPVYGQRIKRVISNEGYSGEHAISIGGNYMNKLFFGATFGISTIRYTGHYQHMEIDDENVILDLKNFTYTDHLDASGTGFSFKIGTIFKPVDFLRIGLAFHAPVGFRIDEYYYDNISANFDNDPVPWEFASNPRRYTYKLSTPMRFIAGIGIQIKKIAILSADYEYVDYSAARFSQPSTYYDYSNENSSIKEILKATSNLRFGGELRYKTVYFRGGYGYYGKAFNSSEPNKDLDYNSYSAGIGYRQQNMYFDFAFTTLSSTSKYYMYRDEPYLQPATMHNVKNTFALTMGFKF
jgi:hypothetical protein